MRQDAVGALQRSREKRPSVSCRHTARGIRPARIAGHGCFTGLPPGVLKIPTIVVLGGLTGLSLMEKVVGKVVVN